MLALPHAAALHCPLPCSVSARGPLHHPEDRLPSPASSPPVPVRCMNQGMLLRVHARDMPHRQRLRVGPQCRCQYVMAACTAHQNSHGRRCKHTRPAKRSGEQDLRRQVGGTEIVTKWALSLETTACPPMRRGCGGIR